MGIGNVFSDANERRAAEAQQTGLTTGMNLGSTYLDEGLKKANVDYAGALDSFSPYATSGASANTAYADALGLNGQPGNDNARQMFSASPGYDYSVDQALQAVERRASSQGQLGSGQTGLDTVNAAYGLANNDYNGWLDRLGGMSSQGLQAAGGTAGVQGNMAAADLATNAGKGEYSWKGYTGIGDAQSDYEKGLDQSGMNTIGAISGGLSLGAKALGLGGFGAPGK
jgi:hypothetical protein